MRLGAFTPIAVWVFSRSLRFWARKSDLPQFRAGVELIQLDVAVLDDNASPYAG